MGVNDQKGKQAVDAGGAVVEILNTGDLDAWITTYELDITTVQPTDGRTLSEIGPREAAYLVDLSNMKVLNKYQGSFSGAGDPSAVQGLDDLIQLVSQP